MIEIDQWIEIDPLIETKEIADLTKDQTTLTTTPIETDPPLTIEADMILTEIDLTIGIETIPVKDQTLTIETTQTITHGVVTTPAHTTLTQTTPVKDPILITEAETIQMTSKIAVDATTPVDQILEIDQPDLCLETPQQTTPAIDHVLPL